MKRKLMLLLAFLLASIGLVIAQTPKKVTGVVISEEDDQPVVGASVLVKGTTMGTVTDIDGKFTIDKVPSSSRTLKISFIGMQTQEVAIKPDLMKIVMKADSEVLEEVVVTGMTKVDKRLFTGAAANLTADNVKLDGLPEISRGLEGRAAGVSVQMDECWKNSISSEKSHSRREFGFTLQMHTYSNAAPKYSFIDGSAMSSNDCSTGGINTITFTIRTNEYNESASYSVALFHTHPPLTNCPSTSSRITGPSSLDDDTANTNKIPSVIFDYGDRNEQIYGGHSSNLPYVISYAGSYDQRL